MRKQNFSLIALCGVLLLVLSIFISCEQEETYAKATVETSQVKSITEATATFVGIITTDGGSEVTSQGFCWSTSPTPTIENDTTIAITGTLAFSSSIKGLTPGTTYYVRAFAVNKGGVAYGLNVIFTTKTFSIATTPISVFLLTATSAIGGGNIISDGDSSSLTVIARGVCWNTFPSPTIENSKTIDGIGGGRFISKLDSLKAFTTYYVRAYATNGNGIIYGDEVSFTTQNGIVGITTNDASSITNSAVTCGGSITSDGGATITERGLCWSTSPSPTTANNKTVNGSDIGTFSANITGLTPGTTYYVRSYGINSVGTTYGNEVGFTTQSGVIQITTNATSLIAAFSATSGGVITSDGGAPVTERGICWNTSPSPTTANNKTARGSGSGIFTSSLTGLSPGTTYYIRAYATNSVGTCYGVENNFTTQNGMVGITTTIASTVWANLARSGGTISFDGGAAVTACGVCWSTSSAPTIANSKTTNGSGVGSYTSLLTGLLPLTTYYVRAYATNSVGTSYGNVLNFKTLSDRVTDVDGNVYSTITIGSQEWMVENLKTTKYNDGTSIPLISDGTAWSALSTPAYCFYNNDVANKNTYGALYNWYADNTGKLAPTGWHVPTDAEWTTLEDFLIANGYNYDGTTTGSKIAKSLSATTDWNSSTSIGAIGNDLTKNNTSGFAGRPGGCRYTSGQFNYIGEIGYWRSSTQFDETNAWYRWMHYTTSGVGRSNGNKKGGFSVRCVRD